MGGEFRHVLCHRLDIRMWDSFCTEHTERVKENLGRSQAWLSKPSYVLPRLFFGSCATYFKPGFDPDHQSRPVTVTPSFCAASQRGYESGSVNPDRFLVIVRLFPSLQQRSQPIFASKFKPFYFRAYAEI